MLHGRDAPKRATMLELVFDVVYVAAFALVSMRLAANLTWSGAGEILVLLMALWWTWTTTALLTDFYDPEQSGIQIIVALTMLGVALMVVAIPFAFSTHPIVFAGAYVGIHLVREVLLATLLRGNYHEQKRPIRFLFWFSISGIAWIAGAILDTPLRAVLWTVAVVIDYLAGALRYPTPRRDRIPIEQYEQASPHIAERYQQVIVLTLGDLILVPALRFASHDFTLARTAAFLMAFGATLLFWQIFVFATAPLAATTTQPGRIGARATRLAPFTHLVTIAGVVAVSAGAELAVVRPTGPTPTSWAYVILGGAALFVLSRTIFEYAILGPAGVADARPGSGPDASRR
ncbi:low temperature requirement protein A [Plantactinospora endophytica]|uniref:low temperature requirement protein A n=1 Tax=Plantactinospora endophytica TaxID=673535 RepID=UPI0019419DE0|nr:low temperature requirement protein A [Plantactinospora endophytica]